MRAAARRPPARSKVREKAASGAVPRHSMVPPEAAGRQLQAAKSARRSQLPSTLTAAPRLRHGAAPAKASE